MFQSVAIEHRRELILTWRGRFALDVANSWLQSGLPALIRGARLFPRPHPKHKHLAFGEEGAQGIALHLYQKNSQREWILKKFHSHSQPDYTYLVSIRSLVPKNITFATATKRVVLTNNDLKWGDGLYCSNEFGQWLGNSILMQKTDGVSWKNIAYGLQTGEVELPLHKRIEFAKSLAHAIHLLANEGCAHRDLSHENVFFDTQEYVTYLVDWDSMFHGSVYFQKNIPAGSAGYTAPWVRTPAQTWDARRSWNKRADRFALSILVAELLLASPQNDFRSEGAMFSSEMFLIQRHPFIAQCIEGLYRISEGLGDLFQRTVTASSYDDCPEPMNWLEALNEIEMEKFPPVFEEYDEEESGEYEGEYEGEYDEEEDEEIYEGGYHRSQSGEYIASSGSGLVYDSSTPRRQLKVNWSFLGILLLPFIVFALYQYRDEISRVDLAKYLPDFSLGPEIVDGEDLGPADGKEYLLQIEYSADDLGIQVGERHYRVKKDNSVSIRVPPGTHPVTLEFSGIRFLADGNPEKTGSVKYTDDIVFDSEKIIKIRIDREEKIWTIDSP